MSQPQNLPKSFLIGSAQNRPAEDPIFAIHGEARERAARGESVIDASLGTLMDEDGGLSVMPSVVEAFRRVDPARAASYAPIAGEAEFNRAVCEDVYGPAGIVEHADCVATAGGTGAIHHSIVNFLDRGDALLTTDYFWGPYSTIADQAGRGVETFRMFNAERRFDLGALEEGLAQQAKKQKRILLVLNFPCHNPTGYSLNPEEWREVVRIVKHQAQSTSLAVLLDLAYAKYGAPGTDAWAEHIADWVGEIPILAAWSASKSFAQYGSRIGGLAVAFQDAEERQRICSALAYTCRGTWSNCNHLGMLAVTELLVNKELAAQVAVDRGKLLEMLASRVEIFNAEASKAGLQYPRYEGGFFVTVFTSDPAETAKRCRDEGLFIVPIQGAVRAALCATPRRQVARLVSTLQKGVAGLQQELHA